ncbi:L-lactate permease [Oscillibacter ruminantium]|uniref:L-lactate permease n=1 Tax=Oscillibacter ruminantium TaxID=1263547 RepID=UPI0002E14487|nr:L-lactate permease [Oscillibacter ruminantium]
MGVFEFVLAASPIAFVLVGILAFKKPAMKVAPLALIWTLVLAFTYFNVTGLTFKENVAAYDALLWKGIKEGGKIVAMVFGAFVILNTLKKTGAIEDVKNTVARISGNDRRVQLIVVGLMVPIFLEGAAGAGAPAAIAAPFLVALGFDPIVAIAVALLGDATPCSWGGAGLTTISGGAALVDAGISTAALNSAMVGRIHMFGVMVIPFIMVAIAFGRKGFKNIVPYLCYTGVTTGATMFFLSNFVGPEITSMGTGILSMLFSVAYVKLVPIKTPEEFRYKAPEKVERKYSAWRAMSPYLYMLILLPAVRYGVPAFVENGFALMCTFGYIVWVDVVIFLCAVLGAITLGMRAEDFGGAFSGITGGGSVTVARAGKNGETVYEQVSVAQARAMEGHTFFSDASACVKNFPVAVGKALRRSEFGSVCKTTIGSVCPVLVTMGSLLVLAYIMQSSTTGMMSLIAGDISDLAGTFYPAAAVFIGTMGSFITGTGLGSNIMFAGMHTQAATTLGMNPITVFAGQNAGASLGNLICANNTVAACATVGQVGNESKVMRKTLPACGILVALYMVLSMVYTLVMFPNFGM